MILTEKQLKIQEYANKTLSFGCILTYFDSVYYQEITVIYKRTRSYGSLSVIDLNRQNERSIRNKVQHNIVGHPMTYGRLCYLFYTDKRPNFFESPYQHSEKLFNSVVRYFTGHSKCLRQTVLERPEELQDLVIEFLQSLPKEGGN